ncbi:MAG TPA: hypothetical protein VFW09_06165 [Solirubrobacteraceae bacterium]|nr:hypothetical protein [Solirubrobacteraceae bacterium]
MRPDLTAVACLPALIVRDLTALALPLPVGARNGALDAAVGWLCRSHDATGRRGTSSGYDLVYGWLPADLEMSGCAIGTILEQALRTDRHDLTRRAIELGAWATAAQGASGAVADGHVRPPCSRSVVLATGAALHGWVDLIGAGHSGFEEAADRGARFLVDELRRARTEAAEADPRNTGIADARTAWALLRWATLAEGDEAREVASRQLGWTCGRQLANGWFRDDGLGFGHAASTAAIASTLRALLEGYCLTEETAWLDCAQRAADALVEVIQRPGPLPSSFADDWRAASRSSSPSATAQLGAALLALHQVTGDARWLTGGLRAVEQAAGSQCRGRFVSGALAGSVPLWRRDGRFRLPTGATKSLADGLMIYVDCVTGAHGGGVGSVAPRREEVG